jgi:hypothetical protein
MEVQTPDNMPEAFNPQMWAPSLQEIADAYPEVIDDIRSVDPVLAGSAFAGLLTLPDLQSNCFRIQTLVHLALAFGEGKDAPDSEFVAKQFNRLGLGICGQVSMVSPKTV